MQGILADGAVNFGGGGRGFLSVGPFISGIGALNFSCEGLSFRLIKADGNVCVGRPGRVPFPSGDVYFNVGILCFKRSLGGAVLFCSFSCYCKDYFV